MRGKELMMCFHVNHGSRNTVWLSALRGYSQQFVTGEKFTKYNPWKCNKLRVYGQHLIHFCLIFVNCLLGTTHAFHSDPVGISCKEDVCSEKIKKLVHLNLMTGWAYWEGRIPKTWGSASKTPRDHKGLHHHC